MTLRLRLHRAPLALALALCLAPAVCGAQTILNVERAEPRDGRGPWGAVDANGSLALGNTRVAQVKGGVLAGYRTDPHTVRLYAGSELLRRGDEEVVRNGYLHLRHTYALSPRWRTFHFVQAQSSLNLLLRRRLLVGGGIRARVRGGERARLDLGTGVMLEDERLDRHALPAGAESRTRTARLANLLVYSLRVRDGLSLVDVAYVQPRLASPDDVRLLNDLGLLVALARRLDLSLTAEWRHDSRPPPGVGKDDFRLATGLAVSLP